MNWQKEAVERRVAKLSMSESLKNQLREELWAHLACLYEEELARYGDAARAREAACRRLGDASAMAETWRETRPWTTRMATAAANTLQSPRHAVRLIGIVAFLFAVVTTLSTMLPGMTAAPAWITWVTGTTAIAMAGATAHAWVRYTQSMDSISAIRSTALHHTSAVMVTALMGYGLAVMGCALLQRQDMMRVFDLVMREAMLPAGLIAITLPPVLAYFVHRRAERLPDWPYA